MAGKIFLSHSSSDTDIVVGFREMIHRASVGVIQLNSSKEVQGGDHWYQRIRALIRDSDELVALLTKDALSRQWVAFEVGMTVESQPRLRKRHAVMAVMPMERQKV